jgi:uncharacterized protein YjbI with pentapeptide repeats
MYKQVEICGKEGCEKQALSFSSFCGEHSDTNEIKQSLSKIKNQSENIYLSGIQLDSLSFKGVDFIQLNITGSELENIIFENCTFENLIISSTSIIDVQFINCIFKDSEWNDVSIEAQSKFYKTSFIYSNFNTCHFNDQPIIDQCKFEFVGFLSCTFFDLTDFNKTSFSNCDFLSISISEVNSNYLIFDRCTFEKTSIEDAYFINSTFQSVDNDFDKGEYPKLCDFTNSKFIETDLPTEFYLWNHIKGDKVQFYLQTISRIASENHANNLWVISTCIEGLIKLNYRYEVSFIDHIISIFREKLNLYVESRNYGVLGSIMEEIGNLPPDFKNSQLMLPASIDNSSGEVNNCQITIIAECDKWTITKISSFYNKLLSIQDKLKVTNELELMPVRKGSIIQTIIGECVPIMKIGGVLATFISFIIATKKGILSNQEKYLTIKQLEINLKYQEELNKEQLKSIKLDNEKKEIDLNKLKKEYQDEIREELYSYALKNGIDLKEYANSAEGIELSNIIMEFHKEFPIKEFKIVLDEEKNNI